MDLEQADAVIRRLEICFQGTPGQLPANQEILDTIEFVKALGKPISSEAALLLESSKDRAPVLSKELARTLRELHTQIETAAARDPDLHRQATYVPNVIAPETRLKDLAISGFLLIYGTLGIAIDDLYIPGKRSKGLHYHGEPAWIVFGAMLLCIAAMLSEVVDHYDRRNNEHKYKWFAKVCQGAALGLFILALLLDMIVYHKATR